MPIKWLLLTGELAGTRDVASVSSLSRRIAIGRVRLLLAWLGVTRLLRVIGLLLGVTRLLRVTGLLRVVGLLVAVVLRISSRLPLTGLLCGRVAVIRACANA